MKHDRILVKVLFVLLTALIILACGVGALGATATPMPTNTPASTNTLLPTNTPAATNTPLSPPTETATSEPPTPAPMGSTVQSANFEVKVIDAIKRDRVYPGGKFYFSPAAGYMLVDIGVKVSNLTSTDIPVKWNDIYIMNSKQDWWISSWGTYKVASGTLDPFSIGVSEVKIDPKVQITVSHDGYLRLFYHIPVGETYYFGFADSPLTVVKFK